ncbi:DUF5305 family protein [Natronolimnohabitans sp. A-GB9]|uniref:DUF5305 family protein n=1 Tax=Natronolimnohabitans sp. A-GB9 TaxID=3069757 RepID=UPI0027ADACF2|nr:DUF5305 family protein [Natronolimnohabitans sp. A-GB9]MDQ2051015.1 DUF5305 family protein [Natronolimnohabitans sp. A-GB9]
MLSQPADTDETDETAHERRLRVRVFLMEYRTALLVAFVLLFALGAWVTYGAYADPGEETDQRLEHAWTATGELSHEATVTESTAVFPNGTVLQNEPVYYTSITPELEGEFVGGYEGETAEDVAVDVSVDLVYRAVDSEDGTVYWSQRETVGSASEPTVAPDDSVTAAFAVDVTDVAASIDEIEAELGASPGETEIYLEIDREIEGTIDGEFLSAGDQYTVDLEYDGDTYEVVDGGDGAYDETREEYETVTVPATVGPLRSIGGPLVALLGLAGAGGLAIASWRLPEPTAAEREWLAYRDDRDEYAELITNVRLPASKSTFAFDETEDDGATTANESTAPESATVDSLEELVQFGIDVGAAVVFDRRAERYVVHHRGIAYVYEPPSLRPTQASDERPDADAGDDSDTGTDLDRDTETSTDGFDAFETAEAAEVDRESEMETAGEGEPNERPDDTETDAATYRD